MPAGLLSLLAVAAEEQPRAASRSTTPSGSTSRRWRRSCSPAGGSAPRGSRCSARCATAPAWRAWRCRGWSGCRSPPLADDEARELLGSGQPERLAPSVADRLVSTAAGNPLALLEIPRLLSDGQRAGREPLEEPLRPGTGVERAFRRALDALDDDARRALLVAATAHTGRLEVIEAALRESGLARSSSWAPPRRRG